MTGGSSAGTRLRPLAVRAGLAGPVVLAVWMLRPGVVENGVRSPRVWLAVVGVLIVGRLIAFLIRRTTGSPRSAGLASGGIMALLGAALLAPSFQQRTLDEPFPALIAAPMPQAPAEAAASSPPPDDQGPAMAVPVATGVLEGVGHSASGRVGLYELDGRTVLRFEEVDVEGTPGPYVHVVPAGRRTPADGLEAGGLKAERGSFTYTLPESFDPSQSWTVLVWCRPFATPVAAADLSLVPAAATG